MDERRYLDELNALSGYVHGRNVRLVRLALLGLRAGRDAGTLKDEIIAAGGLPRLSDAEVARAIATAQRQYKGPTAATTFSRRQNHAPAILAAPNAHERGFVREMIQRGKGAKSGDIREMSRVTWQTSSGAAEFLSNLFMPPELVFAGTPLMPRTRENLISAGERAAAYALPGAILPTHLVPNPFTGEPGQNADGKTSYCLDTTVAHRRHALVEFDELPLEEQAAFWLGVLRMRLLPVRSLVYSGAKSIHGLIELIDDGSAAKWAEQWQTLERLVCSDPDRAYHADPACKNVARFTRFPGAVRPETGRRQALLYLG